MEVHFLPEDQITGFYKTKDRVAVLSGPGGATLRTFDALHGHLTVEKQLHALQLAILSRPHYLHPPQMKPGQEMPLGSGRSL